MSVWRVAVRPGKVYAVSAYGFTPAREVAGQPRIPGQLRLGVDPTGGEGRCPLQREAARGLMGDPFSSLG